jgi:hypothetical protein
MYTLLYLMPPDSAAPLAGQDGQALYLSYRAIDQ